MQYTQRTIFSLLLLITVFFTAPHFMRMLKKPDELAPRLRVAQEDPFVWLDLEARAAYVFDVNSGEVLYEKNATAQLPLASLTKVMTALVATELAPNKGVKIAIAPETIQPEGDGGLLVGEWWRLKNIIDFSLVTSSNDGARALASVANFSSQKGGTEDPHNFFLKHMNEKAAALGMEQTFYINESGLDTHETLAGSYGSAKDMAALFAYVLKKEPHLLEATTHEYIETSSSAEMKKGYNTNKSVGESAGIIASKTGFTDLAGGNLVIAYEAGPMHPIIISVLGSSRDGRFSDVQKLQYAALKKIENRADK